ncbi:MAG: hypothetical protein ABID38_05760 [Candidatus Diapherotrites archaeon]
MERQELELFLKKTVKITKITSEGNMRFFTGVIKQLSIDNLILVDKYDQLVMIKYNHIEHIQTVGGGLQ